MYLYEIVIQYVHYPIGLYIDISIDPEETYKNHLYLLKSNVHNCYKLQYLYKDGHKMYLNVISYVPKEIATLVKIKYIQKQPYVINSRYPIKFDYSKYKGLHYIHKPTQHICKIEEKGIEVDEYGNIEEGYYYVHNDHLERIYSEAQ